MQTPLYFRGASRVLIDVKTRNWYELLHTLLKISVEDMKIFINKIRSEEK